MLDRKKILATERRMFRREERLRDDKDAYLRACGWEYTCDTPGSLWLWRRKYKGKTILVNTDTAMLMQAHVNSGTYKFD